MSNLLLALRIIGWLLAMAIALAASSTSVVYAYRYGITLAASEPEPWLTGLALAVADVVKIGLPATIVALWARAHWGTAGTLGVVFAMLLGLSLWASASITTIERATTDAKITSASKIEADLRAELAAANNRIVELSSPPPLLAVEAEIDGFKADACWRTTEACNPLRVALGSRRFCEQAALKQSAREKAAEADKLRVRVNEIRQILYSGRKKSAEELSKRVNLAAVTDPIDIIAASPLVLMVQAMLVVRQRINDATLSNTPFRASSDHVLDLRLKGVKAFDAADNGLQVLTR